MTRWNDTLLAKLQTLIGERGQRADHAVRWRDLPGGAGSGSGSGSTIILGGAANDPRVDNLITDMDTLNAAVNAAQEAADQAAINALTADQEAQSVRDDHDALVSTFTGNLADLDATLTSVQADLSDAYDSLSGQIRASALSAYFTAAQTTSAIVAESTLLQASIAAVNESVQGWQLVTDEVSDVTAGVDTTVTQGGTALGQPGTIIVSEVSHPGPGQMGAWVTIPVERAILFSGQRIKIGVLARAPDTNAATRFGITYSTNDDSSDYMQSESDLTTGWQWFSFYYDVPQTITGGPGYLFLFGDAALGGNGVEIARLYIEIAAVAGDLPEIGILNGEITDIKGLDLDALDGTAFGALLTQLDVDAGGLSATINTQASAISTLEGNASAGYLIRAQAGNAVSLIDLVAADGSGLTPSSFVRIAGDDILLDGSVAARKLVVHDNSAVFSEVFDSTAALADWQNYEGSGELAIVSTTFAKHGGKALRVGNNSGNDQVWYAGRTLIPFDPDRTYRIRCGLHNQAGTGGIYLGFIGVATDGVTLVNPAGENSYTSQHYAGAANAKPPVGAYSEYTGYARGYGTGGSGTLASPRLMHPNVRYLRPMVLMNHHNASGQWLLDYVKVDTVSDATLIANGAITTEKIVAGAITAASGIIADAAIANAKIANGAVTNAKIANAAVTNAKIGNLAVDTIKVANRAITSQVSTSVSSFSSNVASWTVAASLSFTGSSGAQSLLGMFANFRTTTGSSSYANSQWRVRHNGTVIASGGAGGTGNGDSAPWQTIGRAISRTPSVGTNTFTLEVLGSPFGTANLSDITLFALVALK